MVHEEVGPRCDKGYMKHILEAFSRPDRFRTNLIMVSNLATNWTLHLGRTILSHETVRRLRRT